MKTKDFVWGEILDKTSFNSYTIIKYHPKKSKGPIIINEIDYDEILYSVEELSESFPTFNLAVIGIIVRQNLGLNNSNITYAIGRMIKEI